MSSWRHQDDNTPDGMGFRPSWYREQSQIAVSASFRFAHTERFPNGCCVDCWAKIKPGPPAVLVADDVPHTATTTGGV